MALWVIDAAASAAVVPTAHQLMDRYQCEPGDELNA